MNGFPSVQFECPPNSFTFTVEDFINLSISYKAEVSLYTSLLFTALLMGNGIKLIFLSLSKRTMKHV